MWRGRRMSLILDHVNGIRDDNRVENLQIVCPNCAATLSTHCGRNVPHERQCRRCGEPFQPRANDRHYCSISCSKQGKGLGVARPGLRKVERPPIDRLRADLAQMSFCAVGRKYGVSDNAIRKWLVWYERQARRERAA
jgi:ribosomal protein S27AE